MHTWGEFSIETYTEGMCAEGNISVYLYFDINMVFLYFYFLFLYWWNKSSENYYKCCLSARRFQEILEARCFIAVP